MSPAPGRGSNPVIEMAFGIVRKAKTAKRWVTGPGGDRWEAEVCLQSGTDPQAPRCMIIFRDPTRRRPDRYTLLPPGSPKDPVAAVKTLPEELFRECLTRSTPL